MTCGNTLEIKWRFGRTRLLGSVEQRKTARHRAGTLGAVFFNKRKRDRRILAARSGFAPHRLCSRDDKRVIVGHHLEVTAALTRERGHKRMSAQQNSVWGVFGPRLAFSLTTSLRSVEWNPPILLRPPKGPSSQSNVVTLLDRSPQPNQQQGNQQTARRRQPCQRVTHFPVCDKSGTIEAEHPDEVVL